MLDSIRRGATLAADAVTSDQCCPACTKRIGEDDDAVQIHGDSFHARCAVYRPRRRREARRPA